MEITFSSELFNLKDDDSSSVFGDEHLPTFDDDRQQWVLTCSLGDCDMSAELETIQTVDHIVFSVTVEKQNEFMQTGAIYFLRALDRSSKVTFRCAYPTAVDVETQALKVNGALASSTIYGTGSLDQGFGLKLYVDEALTEEASQSNVFVGYVIYGQVKWSVTTAQNLVNFYVEECGLSTGGGIG